MTMTELDTLTAAAPGVAEGFGILRKNVLNCGPLTPEIVELVVVGALAATGQEGALRVHVRRLVQMDVDVARIRQALVAPLGAASTLTETAQALRILNEEHAGESV